MPHSTRWLGLTVGFREPVLEDSQSDFRIQKTRAIRDGTWTRVFRQIERLNRRARTSIGTSTLDRKGGRCSCCSCSQTSTRKTRPREFDSDRICGLLGFSLQPEKMAFRARSWDKQLLA